MKRNLLIVAISMLYCLGAYAQRNIAYNAVAAHSGGGQSALGFGPENYNDTVIAVGTAQPWGWVSSNGWIEYTWPNPVSFRDIVFYDGGRKVTAGEIQYWDAGTSSYVTIIANFGPLLKPATGSTDSVTLPNRVTTTKLRFNNLAGSNPNFREIEVYEAPSGLHDAGVVAANQLQGVCPATIPVSVTIENYGINKIDSVLVNWSIDGVVQTPVLYNASTLDTLNGLTPWTASVTLGNYLFNANQIYVLKSWTSLPNNTADTTNFNDTLTTNLQLGALPGLTASNITSNSALISWIGLGGTSFDIEWGPTGFTQGTGTNVTALDTFKTVTGFLPLTTYDIYVAVNCGPASKSLYAGPITITTGCPGVLAGTYTLNPAQPYSSTNFVSFTQLALAFDVCGITGPVTVNVAAGASFYELIKFSPVSGASATNTITINGNGATLSYLSTNTNERSTLELYGADYFTIDSLKVVALGGITGEYGTALRLTDGADYNVIRNCHLQGDTVSTSSNYGCFAISGSGSATVSSTSGPSGDYNLIENNTMIGGYYGLVSNGQSADSANGNIIRNNKVRDYGVYGMYIYYNNGIAIEGNDVSRPNRTALTTSYGMYMVGMSGGMVEKNRVHDPFAQNTSQNSTSYGIYMSSFNGTATNPNLVANNMVYNIQSAGAIYGLYPSTASYTDIVHNTVVINNPSSTATGVTYCLYPLGTLSDVNIQNNLFYLDRGGSGTKYLINLSGTLTSTSKLDRNSYYATPATTFSFGNSGAAIATFAGWQATTKNDSNSFFLDPYLVDVANADFTPRSAVIDGLGANFSAQVSTDINGVTRGMPSDPGALEFTGAPCTGPNGLGVTSVSSNNAVIGWNTNTTSFTIEWGPVGFKQASLTGTIVNVALGNTSATLTGMTPNTCYDYYITQNCTSTIPGAPPVLGPLTICTQCATPGLTGVYTIGGTPGPNNFATLDSAVSVLNSCGILAPVVFNMNGGKHNAIKIENVNGASATNTITFNASVAGDSIIALSGTAAIDLDAAKYVTFNDLYVENTGGNFVVWLHNGAKDIHVMDCELVGSRTTTSSATAVVAATNLGTSATSYGDNVNGLTVSGCQIVGNYYGISLNGSSTTSKISNLSVVNNEFDDTYYYGVRTYYTDSVEIRGNVIPSFRNTASYGFQIYYTDFVQVTENVAYANSYGIYSYYTNQNATSAASASTFANNMVKGASTYGMYMYGNKYTNLYHNTIVTDATYGLYLTGSATQGTSSSDNIDVRNNIIANTGTNYAFYVPTLPFGTFTVDNNLYYSNGTNIVSIGGTAYATLAAWQLADLTKNVNSVSGDPQFVATDDFHILGGLANDAGDNTVGITVDVDGQSRPQSPSTVVDIGADEYTPVAHDIAIISGNFSKNGKCLRTNDTIVLEIQNAIGAVKNFATTSLTANWSVTGPVNSTGTITVNTGTLAPQAIMSLTGTPVNLSVPGVYTLNAYINPSSDNLATINDTLISSATITVYPVWEVNPDTVVIISNMTDTVELEAKSPFFGGTKFFITEIMHFTTTVGTPTGGFPSWYNTTVGEHIEITGVPGSDLGGITFEQWNTTGSAPTGTYTFPQGTVLSPSGTAIIAMRTITPDPANFYYDGSGGNTIDWQSSGGQGVILKDANGVIIDAAAYPASSGTYSFPAAANVTSAEWAGGTIGNATTTCGVRLLGPDMNDATNWSVVTSAITQDPNVVNPGVTVPTPGSVQGFTWKLNGNVVDTLPNTVVGPYTAGGVFNYIATYTSPCGVFSDTVTVIVNLPGGCLVPTNISGTAPACDSLIFTWNSAADSSVVTYVTSGGSPTNSFLVVGDSSYAATGLTANTNYDFYVANICNGDTGSIAGPFTLNSGSAGAPVASFLPTLSFGGLMVTFDASGTSGNGNTYAWDFGDGMTGTGVTTSHQYATGGNYSVMLTVTNACGSSDTTIALNGVSLGENMLAQNLRLFPNPATNTLYVEINLAGSSDITVRILDMSGKQVMNAVREKTGDKFEGRLDISNLAQGVYMIEVSDSQYTAVRRLVKE